jgi:ribonucleoside-diphosphate reductase alpha chain
MIQKVQSQLSQVKKRDGTIVAFNAEKITDAILKAMTAAGEGSREDAAKVSDAVIKILKKKYRVGGIPGIEEIQDIVETALMQQDFTKTARAYILYRANRAEIRAQKREIPPRLRELVQKSKSYFRNPLGEFMSYGHYSRWMEEEGRRETYIEGVDRGINFMKENLGNKLVEAEYQELREAILNQEVMWSMRYFWSAGKAARATNVTIYNCAYTTPESLKDFADTMYISMCGTGVGFSVEQQIIQALPQIKINTGKFSKTHVIEDNKEGWANAILHGMEIWFDGGDVKFDDSLLRPYGARLKTMGGRSSGPKPLLSLLNFTRERILSRQGRRLKSIDVHDIMCKEGESVEMGGVRRSAMLSLSDLDDIEMRDAKRGRFFIEHPYRGMANNSAAYIVKPSSAEFLDEWIALIRSRSGERGIFNRGGLKNQLPSRRWQVFEPYASKSGLNPCGEINLRPRQFCNLSEIVARVFDTLTTLLRKARLAAILGTYQATLTKFSYISPDWKQNCEEERLLGVSINGQWDCPAVRDPEVFRKLKEEIIKTNRIYAERFGINSSTCVTCVKPSGNGSQLLDTASGMHPRHSPFYIRRVRISASDPLWKMLRDQKVPYHPELGQVDGLATTYVLEFPVKAPEGAVFRDNLTAIQQLEYWKMVKLNYTEHNPSVTISIGENEWIGVAHWLYENWDILGGLSFLPREDYVYNLAPYEAITEEHYIKLIEDFPKIDYSQILTYEKDDETKGSRELACTANQCEV